MNIWVIWGFGNSRTLARLTKGGFNHDLQGCLSHSTYQGFLYAFLSFIYLFYFYKFKTFLKIMTRLKKKKKVEKEGWHSYSWSIPSHGKLSSYNIYFGMQNIQQQYELLKEGLSIISLHSTLCLKIKLFSISYKKPSRQDFSSNLNKFWVSL